MNTPNLEAFPDLVGIMPYVTWAIRHGGEIPEIIEGGRAVKTAIGLPAKWDAIKANGDRVVATLVDFPNIDNLVGGGGSPSTDDEGGNTPSPFKAFPKEQGLMACFAVNNLEASKRAALEVAVEEEAKKLGKFGDGAIVKLILNNLPTIISSAMTLIGLFKGF